MKNVYDIRREKKLYFISSEDFYEGKDKQVKTGSAAIFVCLYYPGTVQRYLEYIARIDSFYPVYIATANSEVQEKIQKYITEKSGCKSVLLQKENRGRDISALLVACRELIKEYKYICFVHDKMAHGKKSERDTDQWITNMWDNTIKSREYVDNVVNIFEQQENIGLLVPPEPMGEYQKDWYFNCWHKSYSSTKDLAEKFELSCNLSPDVSPITIGTAFWATTKALKKLFDREWVYEDFPEEPMPDDGTISHGIERILAYVAQDAGYDTGTIMTKSYAENFICYMQYLTSTMFSLLNEETSFPFCVSIFEYRELLCGIKDFFEKNHEVYLYGAGEVGKAIARWLKKIGLMPEGFIVTDKKSGMSEIEELPVYEADKWEYNDRKGIIITVSKEEYRRQIERILGEKRISNYIFFNKAPGKNM